MSEKRHTRSRCRSADGVAGCGGQMWGAGSAPPAPWALGASRTQVVNSERPGALRGATG